jgi:tetratricopeptide (TPR) repeat protein
MSMLTYRSPFIVVLAAALALAGCQTTQPTAHLNTYPLEVTDAEVQAALRALQGPPLVVDDLAGLVSSYLSALTAERLGDTQLATAFYQDILKHDPENAAARERAFALLLAQGEVDAALRLADTATSIDTVSGQPMVQLTRFYKAVADNSMDEAEIFLTAAEITSPQMILLQLARAYIDVNKGMDVMEAVATLRNSEISPYLAAFKYYHLGRLYESQGLLDDALVAYRNGNMVDPSSLLITLALGEFYERREQPDKAREVYDYFVSLNPDSAWVGPAYDRMRAGKMPPPVDTSLGAGLAHVVFDFGTIMVSQQLFLTAQQFFQLARLVNPEHALTHFYLGLLSEQDGQSDQAIAYYNRIPEGTAPFLSAQIRIAEALYAGKDRKNAVSRLERLLAKHGSADILHRALAQMHFDMGDFKKAIKHYDVLLKDVTTPERRHGLLFFSRGASYERLRKFDDASRDLEQALILLPDNAMVLNYLGYMWADIDRNLELAYKYIRRAVELRPNDGAIVDSLGWAYYKKGNYEAAVKYLEQATTLLPSDPTINAHLGDVYEKLGRMDEARTQWRRALEFGPEREEERKELKRKLGLKTNG